MLLLPALDSKTREGVAGRQPPGRPQDMPGRLFGLAGSEMVEAGQHK